MLDIFMKKSFFLHPWFDMDLSVISKIEKLQFNKFLPLLDRLEEIYAHMDEKYNQAAEYYNFTCNGCRNNTQNQNDHCRNDHQLVKSI